MSDDYSDDFSRGSNEIINQKEAYIDQPIKFDDDNQNDQNINRLSNDTRRLKKPVHYGKEDNDPNCFVSTSPFSFQEPDRTTHWRSIDKVDIKNIIGGDIQQLNTVMNELAFSNFNDPSFSEPTKEGRKALQVMQYSLQYFMFTQSEMVNRINALHKYTKTAKEQLEQIKKVEKAQKDRIKKQKRTDRKLNEQAMHYEFMMKRFRPDLDPDKLNDLHHELGL